MDPEGPASVSEVESGLTEGRDAGVAVRNRFVVACWCDLLDKVSVCRVSIEG